MYENLKDFLVSGGYTITFKNYDDEYFYAKTKEELIGKEICNIYEEIIIPDFFEELNDNDFFVVYTELFCKDDLLQLCIDIDNCDYTKQKEYILVYIKKNSEVVNTEKYYGRSFIDSNLGPINNFIESINKNEEYELIKMFEEKNDDNVVYIQVNVIQNNKLNKFVKSDIERQKIFFIKDNYISKYNKDGNIKKYFDMEYFSIKKQETIVNILNSYFDNLVIIKKPKNNDLIFGIKGQEFIKRVWHKYEQRFYPIVNENVKL